MNIISVRPPPFDCEIFSETYFKAPEEEDIRPLDSSETDNEDSEMTADLEGSPKNHRGQIEDKVKREIVKRKNDDFLVAGLETGTIIFINVNNLEQIYARFSVHRHQIAHIEEIRSKNLILSLCNEYKLLIWGFQNHRFKLYRQYNLQRPLAELRVFNERILLNFKQGEQVLCVWENTGIAPLEKTKCSQS